MKKLAAFILAVLMAFVVCACANTKPATIVGEKTPVPSNTDETDNRTPIPEVDLPHELSQTQLDKLAEYGRYLIDDEAFNPGESVFSTALVDFLKMYYNDNAAEYKDGYARISTKDVVKLCELLFGYGNPSFNITLANDEDVYVDGDYCFIKLGAEAPDVKLNYVSQEYIPRPNDMPAISSFTIEVTFELVSANTAESMGSVVFTVIPVSEGNGFTILTHASKATA